MTEGIYTIAENTPLARATMRLRLAGDTAALLRPGQFVNIRLDNLFLRRPLSVCDRDDAGMTLIYKVVGRGTAQLSEMRPGQTLNLLVGLGNGYDTAKSGQTPLLIGGGAGVPPLYGLCKALLAEGKTPTVAMGFNTADEVFLYEEFCALGVETLLATADGSRGENGFVTGLIKPLDYSYFYACGPEPMFRAVEGVVKTNGQYSFEERMGCGFGACVGCTCKTKYGNKRICRDGPVLEREEIVW